MQLYRLQRREFNTLIDGARRGHSRCRRSSGSRGGDDLIYPDLPKVL
jgi:hypothetical protein